MKKYYYQDRWWTVKELSEKSGVKQHTLRDRLRRGYPLEQAVKPTPLHESIEVYCEHSHYLDWLGKPINEVYTQYWKWCIKHKYSPLVKQGFSRQIMEKYPMLKTVPTKRGDTCQRIIRMRPQEHKFTI